MIDILIRKTWLSIRKNLVQHLKNLNLSESEAYIILTIPHEGMEYSKIPDTLGLAIGSCTRTLNKLELRGLVYKNVDVLDKRVTRYFLSDKGLESRGNVKIIILTFRESLLNSLGGSKIHALEKILTEIINLSKRI